MTARPETRKASTSGRDPVTVSLIVAGTFLAPLSQWVIFFLIARLGGTSDAGDIALLLAIATPVFSLVNFGMRDGYITLRPGFSLGSFIRVRTLFIAVGVILLSAIALASGIGAPLIAGIVARRIADSFLDLEYAVFQKRELLRPFGTFTTTNGLLSLVFAIIMAATTRSVAWTFAASAMGSIFTLVLASAYLWVVSRAGNTRLNTGVEHQASVLKILGSCWPIAASEVLSVLLASIPVWAVGLVGSRSDIGMYAAAAYLITAGSLVGSSINSVVIGKYARQMSQEGPEVVARQALKQAGILTALGGVVVVAVLFVGVPVFQLIYGAGFEFNAPGLAVVAAAAATYPGAQLLNTALMATNKYSDQLRSTFIALAAAVLAAGVAMALPVNGFAVGALSALAGGATKLALAWFYLKAAK